MFLSIKLMFESDLFEEVAVGGGHEALVEVDDNSSLIVAGLWGILYQQLSHQPIHYI